MSRPPRTIRPLEVHDRPAVAALLRSVGNFSAPEVETALELIDEWLDAGEVSGYLTCVVEPDRPAGASPSVPVARSIAGYVCYGPTPLTESTFDLYWIAVDPAAQGGGYGRALLEFAEADIRRRGGRLLLIETASHDAYAGTIKFYARAGYTVMSRIPDYYRVGDDKLTFGKVLADAA